MTDAIVRRADGKWCMARSELDEVSWHRKENVVSANATREQWLDAAGMNWRVLRSMVRYVVDRQGTIMEYPDKHVLFRSDTRSPVNTVSHLFKTEGHQPGDVYDHFAKMIEKWGGRMMTLGLLFGGSTFWALAEIEGTAQYVLDKEDKVTRRLLLSSGFDGRPTTGTETDVFVVCANTLAQAESSKPAFRKTHKSKITSAQVENGFNLNVSFSADRFSAAIEQFRRLATTRPSGATLVAATGELLKPGFAAMDAKEQERLIKSAPVQTIGRLAYGGQRGGDLAGRNGTAYGWLNAITEYVDHHARTRGDTADDNRVDSAWFGKGAALKQRAMQIAVQMADGTMRYEEAMQSSADGATSPAPDFTSLLSRSARINNRPVLSEMVGAGDDGADDGGAF